jgi:hypothetical protein
MKKVLKAIILTAVIAIPLSVFADNRGTDFWICFPQNYDGTGSPVLYIASDFNTSGTVNAYAMGSPYYFQVVAGGYATVTLPYPAASTGDDSKTQTGIHITSDQPVSIYGLSKHSDSTDGFLALPAQALGTEYIALCYSGRNYDTAYMNSELAVAASQDNTQVHINCPVNPGSRPAPYDITLNAGQVYQLSDISSPQMDLTGTIITSDKPVAVFGGHRCAKIPTDAYTAADYVIEQMPPLNTWGKEYLTMPLLGRSGGDTFRIIAENDGTSVTVNATPVALLNQGQGVQFLSNEFNDIVADKPILVAQFANGLDFDNTTGDPSMMLITPPEQFITSSAIVVPSFSASTGDYITIIGPAAAAGNIALDGLNIPTASFAAIGTSGYSGTRTAVTAGRHTVTSTYAFGIWVYGFMDYDAYSYQGGMGAFLFTPTITQTFTNSPTITPTFTITGTFTDSQTFTPTRTPTFTRTSTLTRTASPTYTITLTRTPTGTATMTRTQTASRTATPGASGTRTRTPTITPTASISPTGTDTPTGTSTPTDTGTPTLSATATTTATDTPIYSPTETPYVSPTDSCTITETVTSSPTVTMTETCSVTPSFTPTPTYTETASPTFTGTGTATITMTSTPTLTYTVTLTATITPTATVSPTALPGPLMLIKKGVYPEPAQATAHIVYWLSKAAVMQVKIFTVSGEVVVKTGDLPAAQGYNSFPWDLENRTGMGVASGVYIYKITASSGAEKQFIMGKMSVLR